MAAREQPAAQALPEGLLSVWGLADATCEPLGQGLINQTFLVARGPDRFVLQRLHPVFSPEVNLDIEAVTRHLADKGLVTPRLVPTADGALWHTGADGTWRLQTFIDGSTLARWPGPETAAAAGRGVGAFHGALLDLNHTFRFQRPGAHDTRKHLAHLEATLTAHPGHPSFEDTAPIAQAILERGHQLPAIDDLPQRIIHGDLKCSNLLLSHAHDRVLALIDLDTLAHGTLAVEMGDALRSWCNPDGEDVTGPTVNVAIFTAAVEGYAQLAAGFTTPEERAALVAGMETLCLELSARFCADALDDSYFGWDADRFPSRSAHNLVRARGQFALATSVRKRRATLEKVVQRAFAAAKQPSASPDYS